MWADATRLRAIANLLLGVSAVWLLWFGMNYTLRLPAFALRTVELTTAPGHVTVAQLRSVVDQVQGNFFTIDLQRTRQSLEQLPWVRQASVRRRFPWALQVVLEEHVALASWNGSELVNTYGEVFHAETDERLPAFAGEAHNSRQIAQTYAGMNRQLQPLQRHIARIALSPRLAWRLELDDGLQVALGREAVSERLARFVRVYPSSVAAMPGVRRVDLRYRDGFATYVPGGAA
ncbi:MAG: cell division protein FtsQ/DivIB [Sideroxyarcus sp.]|nr:cell division protein FtsQ/DivIB [Sideroxyarcus sp.]